MNRFIYQNPVRFGSPDISFIGKMNSAEAENSYRDFFGSAGDFVFFFAGDVNMDEVKRLSANYLASLPAAPLKKEARNIYPPFPQGTPVIRVKKGIDRQSEVQINFGGENPVVEADPRVEKELVAAMVNLAEIRLREIIREKMGASYGIGVYCTQENYPSRRFNASIQFGCEPARAEELAALVIRELRNIDAASVSEDELVKLRAKFIRSRETALKTNEFWRDILLENYLRGEESAVYSEPEKVITSLTAETISRLIRRYFNPDNYVTGILLPEDNGLVR